MRDEEATVLLNEMLLPTFVKEQSLTGRVIEAIPVNQVAYRPHPVARTAFELARHIAATERRLIDGVISGEIIRGPVLPENIQTPTDLVKWYSEGSTANSDRLRELSNEQLLRALNFFSGPIPAVLCLQFALNHSIHHRGQLAAYLRSMGEPVPSIYGESFEDAEARKSRSA